MQKLSSCLLLAALMFFNLVSIAQTSTALPAEYNFKMGVTYEMTNGKPGTTTNTSETTFWFSEKNYSAFESPKAKGFLMVYDLPNRQMLNFMTAQKMVMVMSMDKMMHQVDSMKQQKGAKTGTDKAPTITKTGLTEKILGYSCEQYKITSTSGNSLVWITKELGGGFGNFGQALSQLMHGNTGAADMPDLKGVSNGLMLKMETSSAESGTAFKLVAKSINKEGKTIKTADFKAMSMPGH
jgi:Domain of unknown function (DUF4412)